MVCFGGGAGIILVTLPRLRAHHLLFLEKRIETSMPGWPQTFCVAQDDRNSCPSSFYLPKAGIIGLCHDMHLNTATWTPSSLSLLLLSPPPLLLGVGTKFSTHRLGNDIQTCRKTVKTVARSGEPHCCELIAFVVSLF